MGRPSFLKSRKTKGKKNGAPKTECDQQHQENQIQNNQKDHQRTRTFFKSFYLFPKKHKQIMEDQRKEEENLKEI